MGYNDYIFYQLGKKAGTAKFCLRVTKLTVTVQ
mgnify:CR=1 FL=1